MVRTIPVLVGRKLEYVRLDHAIVLGFSGGRRVLIETVAHLYGPGGRFAGEPGGHPADVLATLLGDTVRVAGTLDTGELRLIFAGRSELRVAVDPDAESWAVTGPDGFLIVCLAGGELAAWGAAAAA